MKKINVILFSLCVSSLAYSVIPHTVIENIIKMGTGVVGDSVIESDQGQGVNNPKIVYNSTSGKWQSKNLNSTAKDIGSGSGSGSSATNYLNSQSSPLDPSFEDGVTQWNCVGASKTSEFYTDPVEGNEKFSRLTATTSGSHCFIGPIDIPNNTTDGGMARFDYKTILDDSRFRICSDSDCVTVLSEMGTITARTQWGKLPVGVIGSVQDHSITGMYARIDFPTIGSIDIDNLFVGDNMGFISGTIGSEVLELYTGDGVGSSDNVIRKFQNISLDTFSKLGSHNHGNYGVKGFEFTASREIHVEAQYCDQAISGNHIFGITINQTNLTLGINSLSFSSGFRGKVTAHSPSSVDYNCFPFVVLMNKGDVLRPAVNNGNFNPVAINAHLRIKATPTSSFTEAFVPEQQNVNGSFDLHTLADVTLSNTPPTYSPAVANDIFVANADIEVSRACAIPDINTGGTCPANYNIGYTINAKRSGRYFICHTQSFRSTAMTSLGNYKWVRVNPVDNTIYKDMTTSNFYSNTGPEIVDDQNYCRFYDLPRGRSTIKLIYEKPNGSVTIDMRQDREESIHVSVILMDNNVANPYVLNQVKTINGRGVKVFSCTQKILGGVVVNKDDIACGEFIASSTNAGNNITNNLKAGITTDNLDCSCSVHSSGGANFTCATGSNFNSGLPLSELQVTAYGSGSPQISARTVVCIKRD